MFTVLLLQHVSLFDGLHDDRTMDCCDLQATVGAEKTPSDVIPSPDQTYDADVDVPLKLNVFPEQS